MRVLMLIVFFLALGAFFVISNENLQLRNETDFIEFGNIFYSWIQSLFSNIIGLTGYVTHFDWLPKNITNSSR